MRILFATSEALPFCKTGGLADVLGSLPLALAGGKDEVAVIMPLHAQIKEEFRGKMTFVKFIYVDLAWRHQYCGLFTLKYKGVIWYFIDNEHYFKRDTLYGDYDDGERYAFFSKAVVDILPSLEWMPDVIHCNDWQTALVPVYLRDVATRWPEVQGIRTVYTIHNIEYQGRYGKELLCDLFGLDYGWWDDGTVQMDGDINLMKAAMLMADHVTTVSPTYARQLHSGAYAHGLESVVNRIDWKLGGILNGIDMDLFNPAKDKLIAQTYTSEELYGKEKCKEYLQRSLGLWEDKEAPVIAMVSRLVGHKGVDLVCGVFDEIMATGAQMVILGKGDNYYEDFFRAQASRFPGRVTAQITYSDELSRRIYAGADLFLMPSKSEPCGLSQMIAMRYGTVPIVRKTGGLADSVRSCQVGQEDGTGFLFEEYNAHDMLHVIEQAVALYKGDPEGFTTVQKRGMVEDFSWKQSAKQYKQIYKKFGE